MKIELKVWGVLRYVVKICYLIVLSLSLLLHALEHIWVENCGLERVRDFGIEGMIQINPDRTKLLLSSTLAVI